MPGDEAIVIDLLVCLPLRPHVVMEDQLENRTLQYDEDNAQSALDDGGTEHEEFAQQRQRNAIFQTTDTQELLMREGLDDFLEDSLLELSDGFAGMFEE